MGGENTGAKVKQRKTQLSGYNDVGFQAEIRTRAFLPTNYTSSHFGEFSITLNTLVFKFVVCSFLTIPSSTTSLLPAHLVIF